MPHKNMDYAKKKDEVTSVLVLSELFLIAPATIA